MQRIGTVDGLYVDGNPLNNTKGTIATAAWFNALQEEVARSIEGLGGVLQAGDNEQLLAVLQAINGRIGCKNRIINGDMRIDTRNAGASQAISPNTYTYTVDRMFAYAGVAAASGQQVDSSISGQKLYQLNGAAGVASLTLGQRIESANIADLAGSRVTLSALLSDSIGAPVLYFASYPNTVDGFGSITQFATGEIPVSSTLERHSVSLDLPANAINGLQVQFFAGAHATGNFKVGEIQIEAGPVFTGYERRATALEQVLCARYAQWIPFNVQFLSTGSGDGMYIPLSWPHMRTAPTVYGPTADPGQPQSNANNVANGIANPAPYGGAMTILAGAAGMCSILGYRCYLVAEL